MRYNWIWYLVSSLFLNLVLIIMKQTTNRWVNTHKTTVVNRFPCCHDPFLFGHVSSGTTEWKKWYDHLRRSRPLLIMLLSPRPSLSGLAMVSLCLHVSAEDSYYCSTENFHFYTSIVSAVIICRKRSPDQYTVQDGTMPINSTLWYCKKSNQFLLDLIKIIL